jgi:hypothetical protein
VNEPTRTNEDPFKRLYGFATKVSAHKEELREFYRMQREEQEM